MRTERNCAYDPRLVAFPGKRLLRVLIGLVYVRMGEGAEAAVGGPAKGASY